MSATNLDQRWIHHRSLPYTYIRQDTWWKSRRHPTWRHLRDLGLMLGAASGAKILLVVLRSWQILDHFIILLRKMSPFVIPLAACIFNLSSRYHQILLLVFLWLREFPPENTLPECSSVDMITYLLLLPSYVNLRLDHLAAHKTSTAANVWKATRKTRDPVYFSIVLPWKRAIALSLSSKASLKTCKS